MQNKNLIFDSHAHYDDEKFDGDREQILSSLPQSGVCCVINNGIDLETSLLSIKFAEKYSYIYAAVGVHPHEAQNAPKDYLDKLRKMLRHKKVVAVGEIGLDYHYDFSPRDVQRRIFEEQLQLAKELNIPVIIHDREAHADTLELLKKYRPMGVVHCFSGSAEMAREVIELGMYIGLGGAVTFKNAKTPVQVAEFVPIDKLLLETDAPYMTPVPFRGQRCDSSHIAITAEKIAQIRNIQQDELLCITCNNAKNLFGINF